MQQTNHATATDWQTVHASFQGLANDKATYEAAEAYWLRAGHEVRVWEGVGCASYAEYVSRMLGYRRHTARDRIRTAMALAELPGTEAALAEGTISWSAARELTRVVTPATEAAWIEAASGCTVREVEEMVAGLSPGDLPGDERDPSAQRRVLRFEVSAATYATFREATEAIQRDAGHQLTQDEVLELMARRILAGEAAAPSDPGRSSYQLAVTRCSDCERTFIESAGTEVQIDPAMAAAVACDVQTVPVATHVGQPGPAGDVATHVGQPQRARQSIPPRIRRAVMREHHNRCAVPGCRHSNYIDVHHIDLRSEDGGVEPDNLVPLCSAHHRAVHTGRLVIERRSSGLIYLHPDGTPYGRLALVQAASAGVRTDVFQALIGLGFRQKEARAALNVIRSTASFDDTLRAALAVLRPRTSPGRRAVPRGG